MKGDIGWSSLSWTVAVVDAGKRGRWRGSDGEKMGEPHWGGVYRRVLKVGDVDTPELRGAFRWT